MGKQRFGLVAASAALGGLVGAAAVLMLHGAPAKAQGAGQRGDVRDAVAARAFVLLDGEGKERANLRVGEDGVSRLSMLDPAGKPRATLGVTKSGGASLILIDPSGESRATLMGRSDGSPVMALIDGGGQIRATLELRRDGSPVLQMRDAAGKSSWSAP